MSNPSAGAGQVHLQGALHASALSPRASTLVQIWLQSPGWPPLTFRTADIAFLLPGWVFWGGGGL